MDSVTMIERQKDRESGWVRDGAQAFMDRLRASDPVMTPHGKAILKGCADRFIERLDRYAAEVGGGPRGSQNVFLKVCCLLGTTHLAAVTLAGAIHYGDLGLTAPTTARAVDRTSVVNNAILIGEMVEHDLRFHMWRKEADKTQKHAIDRMRKLMAGDPKTWRTRARMLERLATIPWDKEVLAVVGADLLGLLVESCPETWEMPVHRQNGRTVKLLRLNIGVQEQLMKDAEALAVTHPRYGAMIIPPRPWRYVDESE